MIKKGRSSGVVLIFVLVFTAAMAAAVLLFYAESENYIKNFRRSTESMNLRLYSEIATATGRELLKDRRGSLHHIEGYEYGTLIIIFELDNISMELIIQDERGKINPNKIFSEDFHGEIYQRVYTDFFANTYDSPVLTDSLLDWIDEDDVPRLSGAEAFYYRTAGYPYVPPNRPLYSVEEILLVRGFDEDILFGDEQNDSPPLIDFITVNSDGKININTARPEIIYAMGPLGFTDENLQAIVSARESGLIGEDVLAGINREAYLRHRDIIAFESSYFSLTATVLDLDTGRKKSVREFVKLEDGWIRTLGREIL